MNKTEHNESAVDSQRQTYQAPQLTVFGSVRSLTASGTGKTSESTGGGQKVPDKKL